MKEIKLRDGLEWWNIFIWFLCFKWTNHLFTPRPISEKCATPVNVYLSFSFVLSFDRFPDQNFLVISLHQLHLKRDVSITEEVLSNIKSFKMLCWAAAMEICHLCSKHYLHLISGWLSAHEINKEVVLICTANGFSFHYCLPHSAQKSTSILKL